MSPLDTGLVAAFKTFGVKHPGTSLSAKISASPRALVISVDGSLDTDNSSDFQRVLVDALGLAKTEGGLIVELSALKYISSTGVGALTSVLVEAERHQISLRLCGIPDRAKTVLDVLGFTAFFSCIDSFREEA